MPHVHAADPATMKFVSAAACKSYYTTSVSASDGQNSDNYCKDKILGFVDACIETKISQYLTSIKATMTDLSNTEQISLKSKYKYECQIANQKELQNAAAKEVAASRSASGNSSAATTAAAVAAATAALTASKKEDQAAANAQAMAQARQQLAKSPAAPTGDKAQARTGDVKIDPTNSAIQNKSDGNSGTNNLVSTPMTAEEQASAETKTNFLQSERKAQPEVEAAFKADPANVNYAESQKDLATAQNGMAAAAEDAIKQVPGAEQAIKNAQEAANVKADAPGNQTAISLAAEKTSADLNKDVSTALTSDTPTLQNPSPAIAYSSTLTTLRQIQTDIQTYTKSPKDSCRNMAEKASMLCVEGTSRGARAAKEVMEVAGPILGIVSSAQKSCSSTAKITRVVNMGLTIASGVCVAAKLTCDMTCKIAVTKLTQMNQTIQSQIASSIETDWTSAESTCRSQAAAEAAIEAKSCGTAYAACYKTMYEALYTPCAADNNKKKLAASELIPKLQKAVANENIQTKPGTSPAIAAGCEGHVKDIALFALQLYGTANAIKSAQSCAEKLASSAAGANAVTTQQYCEKAANVKEQICICQANNMATGCPGAIAAGSAGNQEKGSNIQATKGNSGFAGGFTPPTGVNPSGAKLGALPLADGIKGKAADSSGSGNDGVGFTGGGSGSSGAGAVPQGSENAAIEKKADDNKKWSFGAFSGMGGGFSSLFGGGSNSGKGSGSGTLGEKDMQAVKRELASEKISQQVSSASGKSNWEKVRNMYQIKEASLLSK